MDSVIKEKTILQAIKYLPSLLMIVLIVSITSYISIQHNNDLKKETLQIEKEYIDLNKARIKLHIDVINRYIQKELENSEIKLKQELHNRINEVHNIIQNIYNKNKNRLSKKEIISQIRYAIEPIRFNEGTGYFSIHTMDGINILHPIFKKLEGTLVLNRQDSTGKYPVREAIQIAKTRQEGFLTWDYYKPNDTSRLFKKFGIVKKFEPYNLIITTAIFKEDFENNLKNELLKKLSLFEYLNNEHLFVVDTKKKVLLSKRKKEDSQYHDKQIIPKLTSFVNSTKKSTYLEYSHQKNSEIYSKISYLVKIKNKNWIVGTGFNLDKLTVIIKKKQHELITRYQKKFYTLLFYAILATIVFLILSILFSRALEKIMYNYKKELLKKELEKVDNYLQTIVSLVDLIEKRDFYTAGHSRRVSKYAVSIAKEMQFSSEDIKVLEQIGLLHDIGKVAIPDSILLKPGKLTEQEFHIIKSHASIGYDVIAKIPMFKDFSKIILTHHERYDGSGYPKGLQGEQIPVLASILAIADSFDAMTSTRVYNKTKTVEEALNELKKDSGTLFDPNIVTVAIKALKNVTLETNLQATQLPKTPIEIERFSYFFKDGLTNLSNENYLDLILKQDSHKNRCLNLILIHNFSQYNEKFGWKKGDELLIHITQLIKKHYVAKEIFRFQGSDFILLNDTHIDINLDLLNKELNSFEMSCELRHMDLNSFNNLDTIKQSLNK